MWELETHRSRCLHFGVDGNGNGSVNLNTKADALASTANFLKGHGWVRGAGYQPGQPNFTAIQGWNAAGVYQKAIAIVGKKIRSMGNKTRYLKHSGRGGTHRQGRSAT